MNEIDSPTAATSRSASKSAMNMKAAVLLLTLTVVAVPSIVAADPVKVFLFTKPSPGSAAVDEQLKALQESLREIVGALQEARYQASIAIVQSRDAADVIVELVSRGETTRSSASSSTRSVGAGGTASASRSASETRRHLKFLMTIGASARDLTTEGQQPWSDVARIAAADIARWTAANAGPRTAK